MAVADQRETRRHRSAGYAAAGYPPGPGPHGGINCGHCTTAPELCGADGAGVQPPAAGRGNRGGEGQRRPLRAEVQGTERKLYVYHGRMAQGRTVRQGGGKGAGRSPWNVPAMVQGVIFG